MERLFLFAQRHSPAVLPDILKDFIQECPSWTTLEDLVFGTLWIILGNVFKDATCQKYIWTFCKRVNLACIIHMMQLRVTDSTDLAPRENASRILMH